MALLQIIQLEPVAVLRDFKSTLDIRSYRYLPVSRGAVRRKVVTRRSSGSVIILQDRFADPLTDLLQARRKPLRCGVVRHGAKLDDEFGTRIHGVTVAVVLRKIVGEIVGVKTEVPALLRVVILPKLREL